MREQGRNWRRLRRMGLGLVLAGALASCGGEGDGGRQAEDQTPSARLRAAVTAEGLASHLRAFQGFADAGDGSRAEGSIGYTRSLEHVAGQARAAGYRVTVQPFRFRAWRELQPTVFELVAPVSRALPVDDLSLFPGSRSVDVTAVVQPTNDIVIDPDEALNSTSACQSEDFAGFVPGRIALVQSGSCAIERKVAYAATAGAAAIVIIDEPPERALAHFQPLERPIAVPPALFVSYGVGAELYRLATHGQPLRARISIRTGMAVVESANVLAESTHGRRDRTVVVGAHLDSIVHGPGLNDNGSGSAAVLELSRQIAATGIRPANRIVFAWWGGEESGFRGSKHYLGKLPAGDLAQISAYLNLDMIGSPNFGRLVLDGDGSVSFRPGPPGSDAIERLYLTYFRARGLRTSAPSTTRVQSDDAIFAEHEVAVGGLFTGAGESKPDWQVEFFGGKGEAPYDACYHTHCDRYPENVNLDVAEQMADATADVLLRLANRGPVAADRGSGESPPADAQ